jgi:hypothetical protein
MIIAGEQKRDYLATLRKCLTDLNSEFQYLGAEEKIPLPDHPDVHIPYQNLLNCELEGETLYSAYEVRKKYPVADLLNGIESPRHRQSRRNTAPLRRHSSRDHQPDRESSSRSPREDQSTPQDGLVSKEVFVSYARVVTAKKPSTGWKPPVDGKGSNSCATRERLDSRRVSGHLWNEWDGVSAS